MSKVMAAIIEKVANLAYKTFADFSQTSSLTVLQQRLPALKALVGFVTSSDVCLDERLVRKTGPYNVAFGDGAPVTYMHLWEDSVLSMGVFIVKHGMSIPLHDHPSMYGIIKVLHGTMQVSSFSEHRNADGSRPSVVDDDAILKLVPPGDRKLLRYVEQHPDALVTGDSDPCVLTPTVGNFHEITAVGGPVAFLDILAPPYDHDPESRECHYYKQLSVHAQVEQDEGRRQISCLVPVSQPRSFWCDSAVYTGPKLRPDIGAKCPDRTDHL